MNDRRGFALLTVLWLLLLLGTLTSTSLSLVALERQAGENRIYRTRAKWAALGCLELIQARHLSGSSISFDSVALGTIVWCDAEDWNPDERINANIGDSVGLQRFLQDEVRVASLLDWIDPDDSPRAGGAESDWYSFRNRPFPRNAPLEDPMELQLVRGFEDSSVEELRRSFTTRGDGRIAVNRAPRWALRSVALLSSTQVETIVGYREQRRLFDSPEQLVAVLGLEPTIDEFDRLSTRLSFSDSRRTVFVRGVSSAGDRRLTFSIVADLTEAGDSLSVTHLEVR